VKTTTTTATPPWTAETSIQPVWETGPVYKTWFDTLIATEGFILRTLGFILYWIPQSHAHAFLGAFAEYLHISPFQNTLLLQRVWHTCNDAYRTDACVRYDAAVICTAAILVSLRNDEDEDGNDSYRHYTKGAWWIPLIGAHQQQALADCANLLLSLGGDGTGDGDDDTIDVDVQVAEVAFLQPLCPDSFNGPTSFLWAMEEGTV
jgi:hypothetical protein